MEVYGHQPPAMSGQHHSTLRSQENDGIQPIETIIFGSRNFNKSS